MKDIYPIISKYSETSALPCADQEATSFKIVSIITPSYNQGGFIAETIESVISQKGSFYIDYIIIDACSTDDSVEIIKKYERLLRDGKWLIKCRGINYRWISEKDKGQSDGINKGFKMAAGKLLGWLNSDDLYAPDALQQIVSQDWSKTDFCYGKGVWINKFGREISFYPTFSPNKYSLKFHCTLCQPAVFFKRDSYERLGEISVNYDLVLDYEYWLRAVFNDFKFLFVDTVLAKSRMYQENKSISRAIPGSRERDSLLKDYYSGKTLNAFLLFFWRKAVDSKTIKMNGKVLAAINEVLN